MTKYIHPIRLSATICLSLATAALFTGCKHLGPQTVAVDRFDYSSAIADSWKQQTLLNIVKLRYMDLPVFVDVSSIVAGYSMQTGVSLNGTLSTKNAIQGNYVAGGGQAIYTDRPTITYTPLTGEKFLRGLMTPIEPKNIFFMLQSGYAADFVLGLTVESLNGVRNRSTTAGSVREADPEFTRVLQLLREVQAAGAVGMRVEVDKSRDETAMLFFRRDNAPPEIVDKIEEIRQLLKLPEGLQKFNLVYSPVRGATNELAVGSRSMVQVMGAFASYADVPEQDLKDGRAPPSLSSTNSPGKGDPVKIKCSKDKPADAFATVHYHGHWFWIDDGDWRSKRALTAVMFLFTMAETGGGEKLPLITIPAQ
ncbi:MAG: hypothetical protein ABSC89_12810 [Verrucomicrobiota bacterium]|jgi:hypothetical protein